MRRWFPSYHSPDQTLAGLLKAAIERKEKDVSVFFGGDMARRADSGQRRWTRRSAPA